MKPFSGTPHGIPGQTLPTTPPEQPSPEPPPLTRNTDGAQDQQGEGLPSLGRRRDDEDEDSGNVRLTRNAGSPGAVTQSLGVCLGITGWAGRTLAEAADHATRWSGCCRCKSRTAQKGKPHGLSAGI